MDSTAETLKTQTDLDKDSSRADRIVVTYYTDPLCCWSWALEGSLRRLRGEYSDRIAWRYVMGGMIQDWQTYNDPMNAINKPLQFGPIWMHASQVSGIEMDYSIWHQDPPVSSYPSCIAVKCAAQQSPAAEEALLYHLREAVMTRALNISKQAVISSIAKEVASKHAAFDYDLFQEAWNNGTGLSEFRRDLQQTRFFKIGRFPTITFADSSARGIIITGYRPYEVLKDALMHMVDKQETA